MQDLQIPLSQHRLHAEVGDLMHTTGCSQLISFLAGPDNLCIFMFLCIEMLQTLSRRELTAVLVETASLQYRENYKFKANLFLNDRNQHSSLYGREYVDVLQLNILY